MASSQTSKYRTYTAHILKDAVQAVRSGLFSIRKASFNFNIPKTSLIRALNDAKQAFGPEVREISLEFKRCGPPTLLTAEEEDYLYEFILNGARLGMPKTPDEVKMAAKTIVSKFPRASTPDEWIPGRKWLGLFLKRHPLLSLKYGRALKYASAVVSVDNLRRWHNSIRHYFENSDDPKLRNLLLFPEQLWNCDESPFPFGARKMKVFGDKGTKQINLINLHNEKESQTVMYSGSACGKSAPPLIVCKSKNTQKKIKEEYERVGAWYDHSENGWMTSAIFVRFLVEKFVPFIEEQQISFPIAMFCDNHSSHRTKEVFDALCELKRQGKEIILVGLYANATHILQPLDTTVFGALKQHWRKFLTDEIVQHGLFNFRLTKENFGANFMKMIRERVPHTPRLLKRGFEKCGMFPFDFDGMNLDLVLKNEVVQRRDHPEHPSTRSQEDFRPNHLDSGLDQVSRPSYSDSIPQESASDAIQYELQIRNRGWQPSDYVPNNSQRELQPTHLSPDRGQGSRHPISPSIPQETASDATQDELQNDDMPTTEEINYFLDEYQNKFGSGPVTDLLETSKAAVVIRFGENSESNHSGTSKTHVDISHESTSSSFTPSSPSPLTSPLRMIIENGNFFFLREEPNSGASVDELGGVSAHTNNAPITTTSIKGKKTSANAIQAPVESKRKQLEELLPFATMPKRKGRKIEAPPFVISSKENGDFLAKKEADAEAKRKLTESRKILASKRSSAKMTQNEIRTRQKIEMAETQQRFLQQERRLMDELPSDRKALADKRKQNKLDLVELRARHKSELAELKETFQLDETQFLQENTGLQRTVRAPSGDDCCEAPNSIEEDSEESDTEVVDED